MAISRDDMVTTQDGIGVGHINLMVFVEQHPALVLALAAVIGFFLYTRFKAGQAAATSTSTSQDLSGLQTDANGNPVVYVPTQTEFLTDNSINAAAGATIGPVDSPTSTTTSTVNAPVTTTTNNPTQPVILQPPILLPNPFPRQPPITPPPQHHGGSLIWDQQTEVLGGQNLTRIASAATSRVRSQGAPSSITVTWSDVYAHNQGIIDDTARMHGQNSNFQNFVFPGERLTVPRWQRG